MLGTLQVRGRDDARCATVRTRYGQEGQGSSITRFCRTVCTLQEGSREREGPGVCAWGASPGTLSLGNLLQHGALSRGNLLLCCMPNLLPPPAVWRQAPAACATSYHWAQAFPTRKQACGTVGLSPLLLCPAHVARMATGSRW